MVDVDDALEKGLVTCLPGVCCSIVSTGEVGVVQRFGGNYIGYQEPGCIPYCPCIDTVSKVSMAVKQLNCTTACKTHDNVTLTVHTAITYRVKKSKLRQAVFEIEDPEGQMRNYADNIVRSALPAMDLDEVYSNKETLCGDIQEGMKNSMTKFGYDIVNALVTDLSPDPSVMQAMNEINAARRQRVATTEKAEAQKILQVKAAEADAEAKFLSGQGIARMRKAMAEGVKESMQSMTEAGMSTQDAVNVMLTTQYIDTLKDFAANPKSQAIMVPSHPGAASDLQSQIQQGFITANALSGAPHQQKM
jgi:regulator of protease activity HflC (stomatin/prohibitin superfamily)